VASRKSFVVENGKREKNLGFECEIDGYKEIFYLDGLTKIS
jgi:hypothetical protein